MTAIFVSFAALGNHLGLASTKSMASVLDSTTLNLVPVHSITGHSRIQDGDPLLIWQIESQRDTIRLAEETAFVQRLKRAAIRDTEEDS